MVKSKVSKIPESPGDGSRWPLEAIILTGNLMIGLNTTGKLMIGLNTTGNLMIGLNTTGIFSTD